MKIISIEGWYPGETTDTLKALRAATPYGKKKFWIKDGLSFSLYFAAQKFYNDHRKARSFYIWEGDDDTLLIVKLVMEKYDFQILDIDDNVFQEISERVNDLIIESLIINNEPDIPTKIKEQILTRKRKYSGDIVLDMLMRNNKIK